jgi:threonine efflux protein
MSWEALVLVLAIHAVALVSPGPDFAIVTRLSIVAGRRTGLWAASGVVSAIGVYVLICALGLSVVIAALPWLSKILSVTGALYLAWLGIQCLRSKGELPEASSESAGSKAFITGFFTNLLNPKAMLYFGSILSQVLTPDLSTTDTTILWGLLVGESLLWFGLVAVIFSSRRVLEWLRGRLIWFDRVIGLVLIGLAAKVAMSASR